MPQKYFKNRSVSQDGELLDESSFLLYYPFKEGVGYNFKYRSTFVKNYLGISLPCDPKGKTGFTDLELGRVYRISRLMYSDSNLLARRTNNHLVPISRNEIQIMLGMHRTKFVPFWKKISQYSILKPLEYDNDTYFCMNPLYYNSTTYLPIHIFLAFQKDLKEHLPDWAIEKYLEIENPKKKTDENKESEIIANE